jgi:hypothetical protein
MCPPCAWLQGTRWLLHQKARLLACDHYHIIFTIPRPPVAADGRDSAQVVCHWRARASWAVPPPAAELVPFAAAGAPRFEANGHAPSDGDRPKRRAPHAVTAAKRALSRGWGGGDADLPSDFAPLEHARLRSRLARRSSAGRVRQRLCQGRNAWRSRKVGTAPVLIH